MRRSEGPAVRHARPAAARRACRAALRLCALAAWPGLAAATPYDGVYRQHENAECALLGVDGGALLIREGVFYGVDAQCRMTRPVDVLDMNATLYTMECTGEGQSWTARAMLMQAADGDGIIMVWNGYAFRYNRCPADRAPTVPPVDSDIAPVPRPDDLEAPQG